MKLKFSFSLSVLIAIFMSTLAFAEDQAVLDWHNTVDTFIQKVKAAEGFDYLASENSNFHAALDTEVKRLANLDENSQRGFFFFLCSAHKTVMRQFHSASYDLVKLGSTCSSLGTVAENWVPIGKKSDRGEYFRDMASVKSKGDFVVVKDKIVFAEKQNNDSLIYQIVITNYAVDCNAKTAASTSYSYQSFNGEVITAFEIPRSKWSFDSEGYEALGMAGVCILSGTTTLSKLEALKIVAAGGDASAQHTLGLMFLNGKDVPKDISKAIEWLQKAAAQNHAGAQGTLSSIYMAGDGVPKDEAKAVEWGLKAAAQGGATDQFLVGSSYMFGRGVIKDYVRAYAWFNLAAAQGEEAAIKARDYLEKYKLTADQRTEGQRLASRWRKGDALLTPGNKQETIESSRSALESEASPKLSSTGSGFVVSTSGHLLTNQHVVSGCRSIKIRDASKIEHNITVVASDARNDLALLKTSTAVSLPAATFRANDSIEAGENVVALGYPLAGVLASEVNVSFGYVSATAGLADDTSKLQISAPVQPGNSGGPLLDQTGNLIGVVVAKLDAIKIAKAIGDIPQNINFAVKGEVAQVFLKAHKVKFKTATATKKLQNTDIASRGRAFTVLVECYK